MKYQDVIIAALTGAATTYMSYNSFCPWLGKDIQDIKTMMNAYRKGFKYFKQGMFMVDIFEMIAENNYDKYFIIHEDQIYTYGCVLKRANMAAHVIKNFNLKANETVAMLMYNEPAFVWTLFGLLKCGLQVALINTNLRQHPLVHSLQSCGAKLVIVSAKDDCLITSLEEITSDISDVTIVVHDEHDGLSPHYPSLSHLMKSASFTNTPKEWREHVTADDPMCYIFTSGTTGLPKPAILTQARTVTSTAAMFILDIDSTDILYLTMPLYHSSALIIGLFSFIQVGGTVVIRHKFSASHFWDDCRKHRVTVFQYIGELCRYLLAQPPNEKDGIHNIKGAIGNGLRKDIWEEFVTRFKMPHLVEIFAATEGTTALFNQFNKVGAVGRYSPLMKRIGPMPKFFAKYDPDTDLPARDKNGRCISAAIGEPGLFLAPFPKHYGPGKLYKGDQSLDEKKLVRSVVKEGDLFFNFGDLLYLDNDYFVYFSDRLGDTFRWQGENVSTQEVADVLTRLDFIIDACVYGVEIPGRDGRAGMAMVSLVSNESDITKDQLDTIYLQCCQALSRYARPLFLRLQNDIPTTGTFKQRKVDIVKESFYHDRTSDPLYVIDNNLKTYVPLTTELLDKVILTGASKL